MGLRACKLVGEKSLAVEGQVYDLMLLLFVLCYLLATKFMKSIVIIWNQLCLFWMNFGHSCELEFLGISS